MIYIALQKKLTTVDEQMLLDVTFSIKPGSFITLYGDSGVGKTSILRMIAGLLSVDQGHIRVSRKTWLDTRKKICLKPQQRKIGFMFQEYTLFANMTVKENLLFALEKGQDKSIIKELIEIIELEPLQDSKPEKLSGGQKQRVALARAMVRKPEILMLDEPLSALDQKMRSKLQDYILKIHQKYAMTTILISHEISEIIKMSDYVFMLDQGKIIKQGNPIDLLTNKSIDQEIQFIGEIILIEKEINHKHIVTLLTGANIIHLSIDKKRLSALKIGDKVQVTSDTFSPVLKKINPIS